MSELTLYGALALIQNGYGVYLLKEGTKKHAFKNPRILSRFEIEANMQRGRYNVAVALGNGLMVADLDSEEAFSFCKENKIESPMTVTTSRGEHRYFRTEKEIANQINYLKKKIDLLFHGYAVAPPSFIADTEFRYSFKNGLIPRGELPLFPQHLIPDPKKCGVAEVRWERSRDISNPEAYVKSIKSVQSQGGSKALVRAVCILRDCGRSSSEAYEYLVNTWNLTNADPPWSESEIQHAVDRHYRRTS